MKYLVLIFFILFSISLVAKIYIIPENFATIQEGINNAANGDTIIVKPGVYKESITVKNKSLLITSKFFLAHDVRYSTNTILNGEGKNTPVTFLDCPDGTVFMGFSIINGYAKSGGGIFIKNSSVNLEDINIIQNTAEVKGGGIFVTKSNVNFINITVSKNSAIGVGAAGGGIFINDSDISAVNLDITDNLAFLGGGFYALNTQLQIKNSKIQKNNAESKAGGMYLINCNDGVLKNLQVIENSAYKPGGIGGGISMDSSNPIIVNSKISKNIAYKGGGVYLTYANAKFVNCLIDNNKAKDVAGAMLIYHSKPELQNITMVDNGAKRAAGISCNRMTNLKVMNSIFWNNKNSDIELDYTSSYDLSYTMINGNYSGLYIYDKEPIFKDYNNKNYHLNKTSFGINKGNPNKKYSDIDGSRNDLGCYGGKFGNW